MITTIGVSYVLFNVVLLTLGSDSKNFPNPMPPVRCGRSAARSCGCARCDLGRSRSA